MWKWIFAVILVQSFAVLGQAQTQNPFEIKKRLARSVDTSQIEVDSILTAPDVVLTDSFQISDISDTSKPTPDTIHLAHAADSILAIKSDTSGTPDTLATTDSIIDSVTTADATPDSLEEAQIGIPKSDSATTLILTDTLIEDKNPKVSELLEEFKEIISSDQKGRGRTLILSFSILLMLILSSLLGLFRSVIQKMGKSLLNDNSLRVLMREYEQLTWVYWMYYIFFFLNLGYFIFFAVKDNIQFYQNHLFLLLILIGGVFTLYFIRHIFLFAIGNLFNATKETQAHSFIILVIHCLLGLVLFPINLLLAFAAKELYPWCIWTGLGAILFAYIFRQLRGIFIASRFLQNNRFQFFLYLCAVEIAPILIVAKLLSDKIYF